MKIPEWIKPNNQISQLGRLHWSVARLIELSKGFPILEIPLDHLNVHNVYKKLTLREMAMHIKAVMGADLSYPIILDEDGDIMDGRHRIIKAMVTGQRTIKAVRFDENPYPCKVDD